LSLAYALGNLGHLETARRLTAELAEMAPTLGDPSMFAIAPFNLGQIALAEGDPAAAIPYLENAERIASEAEIVSGEIQACASYEF
jgi:Flp pilus assembly protein TadD